MKGACALSLDELGIFWHSTVFWVLDWVIYISVTSHEVTLPCQFLSSRRATIHSVASQVGFAGRSQCCCWGDFTRSKDKGKGLLCRVWTALALIPFSKLLFIRIYIWIYTYTKIQKSFGVSKARPREILNHFGQQPQYIPPEPQFFQRMRCSVSFLHFAHLRLCLCPKVELICRRLTNLERFRLWNRVEEVGDENRAGITLL